MRDEEKRRAELAVTAENTAALLIQYDRRIATLEFEFRAGISLIKWVGTSAVVLLASLLASNLLRP
jgi:hypothetical protein